MVASIKVTDIKAQIRAFSTFTMSLDRPLASKPRYHLYSYREHKSLLQTSLSHTRRSFRDHIIQCQTLRMSLNSISENSVSFIVIEESRSVCALGRRIDHKTYWKIRTSSWSVMYLEYQVRNDTGYCSRANRLPSISRIS